MKTYIIKEEGFVIGEIDLYPVEVKNLQDSGFILISK